MKSTPERLIDPSFYRPGGPSAPAREAPAETLVERFTATAATAGPWGPSSQHGGPPAALLARALERLGAAGDRVVARFTLDLLGPVPVGPVEVEAAVVRRGRSVLLAESRLRDPASERVAARASAWLYPDRAGARATLPDAGHTPEDGVSGDWPESWSPGYLDAIEWRWVKGSARSPGPGVVWMRPRVPLLPDEQTGPVQRLLLCVDSASGVSAELDLRRWQFLNTELTVHVLRRPVGEWLCLDARTTLGPGSVGLTTSSVYDEQGLVARSAQTLLVTPR